MKKIFLVGIMLYCASVAGQSLYESLSGTWICNRIVDSENVKTMGKYGDSDDFLKLSFESSSLAFSQAPYDFGLRINYTINNADSTINLALGKSSAIPEKEYRIKHLSTKYLIMQTKNSNNNSIYYVFQKQVSYPMYLSDSTVIDCGSILVKHLRIKNRGGGRNKVAEYIIQTDSSLYFPIPIFVDEKFGEFGHFFTNSISLPKYFPMDTLSSELEVQFEVTAEGAGNFQINKSFDPEIDNQTLMVLEKTKRSWQPVLADGEPVKSIIRLHFYFYYGLVYSKLAP